MASVYLDNNASTRPDPLVVEAVAAASIELFANPSSAHLAGGRAAEAVEKRVQVADVVGARAGEVVFTSGATACSTTSR